MPRTRELQERHNELRRISRANSKQAVFVMDYIQSLYPEIYNEATGFYTLLKSRYPDKIDLKKTQEYMSFKKLLKEEELASGERFYFDIQTGMVMVRQPQNPNRFETIQTSHSSPPESSQTPDPIRFETIQTSRSPAPESPQAPDPSRFKTIKTSRSPAPESSQTPDPNRFETIQTSRSPAPESPQALDSSRFQTIQTSHSPSPQIHQKELEPRLRIPLMSRQETNKRTVSTETLSIITEQEVPSVPNLDIPPEIIDEIITQLRQDPNLNDIFQDLDFEMEFDALGEDLDLPETSPIEQEPWW